MKLAPSAFSQLNSHLLDLIEALRGTDIPLVLVGGYALYLRRAWVQD